MRIADDKTSPGIHVRHREIAWTAPDCFVYRERRVSPVTPSMFKGKKSGSYFLELPHDSVFSEKYHVFRPVDRRNKVGSTALRLGDLIEEYVTEISHPLMRVERYHENLSRHLMHFYRQHSILPSICFGAGVGKQYLNSAKFIDEACKELRTEPLDVGGEKVFTDYQKACICDLFYEMVNQAGIILDPKSDIHRV